MSESTTFTIPDPEKFKRSALQWANGFDTVLLLDSNNYPHLNYKRVEWQLAADSAENIFTTTPLSSFSQLSSYLKEKKNNVFGFLSYDLKNEFEKLESKNDDRIGFPLLHFFEPRYLLEFNQNKLTINRNYPEAFEIYECINNLETKPVITVPDIELNTRTTREEYLANVEAVRSKIAAGDFYELNYCNEFFCENVELNPVEVFMELNKVSKAPFSCFLKWNNRYLLCASPERFLFKEGSKVVSQPIKGTIRKSEVPTENETLKQKLKTDIKEIAENVMIVDLVRNDLAHTAQPGSIRAEELFNVYEFETVNHLISTISAECSGSDVTDIIQHAFPMGSMTGAPKVEVMKNIERFENFRRGLFSGSVGYITPEGNFDFNVVIRSILYNATDKYLSVPVGGAITYDSVAENEWDEINLKAKAIKGILKPFTV